MPVPGWGEAQLFVYNSQHSLCWNTIRNQQLTPVDTANGVYFLEARNMRSSNLFYENCLAGVILENRACIGITYYLDYKGQQAHVWLLKWGQTIDCCCNPSRTECHKRTCGFLHRFQPHSLSFGDKHLRRNFFFLNQLNHSMLVRSAPKSDVLCKKTARIRAAESTLIISSLIRRWCLTSRELLDKSVVILR